MTVRLRVLLDGIPFTNLDASAFTLFEDGTPLPFSLLGSSTQGEYELAYVTASPDGQDHLIDLSVSGADTTAYATVTNRNCHISGFIDLENGVPVTGISGTQYGWSYFILDVPADQGRLDFRITGGTGDADLYVRQGQPPTLDDYDERPYLSGNEEIVTIADPLGGEWYVGLYSVEEFMDLTLVGTFTPLVTELNIQDVLVHDCPQIQASVRVTLDGSGVGSLTAADFTLDENGTPLNFSLVETDTMGDYLLVFTTPVTDGSARNVHITANVSGDFVEDSAGYAHCSVNGVTTITNNELVSDLAAPRDEWLYFKITVPSGQDVLKASIFDGRGDPDLYMRYGQIPDLDNYDHRPYSGGSDESIRVDDPAAGDWYIGIFGYRSFRQCNLRAWYFVEQLELALNDLILADCPEIQLDVSATDQNGPLSGLSIDQFSVSENNGTSRTPDQLTDLGEGNYRLTYRTDNNNGSEVYVRAGLTHNNLEAHDTGTYSNCSREGALVDVWIHRDHAAPPGAEITVPVRVQALDDELQVNSFRMELTYDASRFLYLGLDMAESLTADWELLSDAGSGDGIIFLDAADLDLTSLATTEDGVLAGLRFLVNGTEGTCSELRFQTFSFNDNQPLAATEDGRVCVAEGGCVRAVGDIDGDGNDHQSFDARQILLALSGLPTDFDPIPNCVSDTNCSGATSFIDAVLILQKNVEIIDGYCLDEGNRGDAGTFTVSIPSEDLSAPLDSAFELNIELSQLVDEPVYGYGFELTWDPEVLTLSDTPDHSQTITGRWAEPLLDSEAGRLTVTHVYALEAMEGPGTLLRLAGTTSHLNSGDTTLEFTRFSLASASEPESPFSFTFAVEGEPCFDVGTLYNLVENWWTPTDNILELIELINCTNP